MKTGKNIKTPKSNGAVAGLSRDVRVPHKASRSYGLRHVQGIFPACAVVLFCALLFTIQTAAAQSPAPQQEPQQQEAVPVPALPAGADSASIVDRFALYYWRDRIDLDENYLDNARQMTRIKRYLAESPHIDSITVYAYASPEGVYEHNVWLARKRAEAAKRYILEHIPAGSDFDASRIRLCPMEENWDGLEAEIEANYHRSNREQVLAILRAPVRNDTKKWRLQQIDGGGLATSTSSATTCRNCVWRRGSASGSGPCRRSPSARRRSSPSPNPNRFRWNITRDAIRPPPRSVTSGRSWR